ncbi:uncharacterized protein LOC127523958 isoform X3 [Ctenopharyngodon idella]|uniref:uncharacterized protein LOC127523958 isoform X3 n=1 Tax=Ctenopharyngodon idella TaxID=7959 RepID=UPI0022328704|nr:uncharacterized protein LOC127523958 isoform X3 [Ctenopharyngodon idella]
MKFPLTVCVFLLTVISSLSVDITVRGTEGEPVSIKCPYPGGYKNYFKYFLKGPSKKSVLILQSDRGKSKGRFSLQDDHKSSFTVTISNLKMEDAGTYGCRAGAEHYKEVNLIVIRAPETTRPVQISTSTIRPHTNSSTEHTSNKHTSNKHTSNEHTSTEHTSNKHTSTEHTSTEHTSNKHTSNEHTSNEHTSTVTHQTETETTRTTTGNTRVELHQQTTTMRTDLVSVAGGLGLFLLVLCSGTLLILKMRKRKCGTVLFQQNVQHNTETDHMYEEIPKSDGAVAASSSSQMSASHLNTHPKVSTFYTTVTNQQPDSNLSHTHSTNQVTDWSSEATQDSRTELIYVTATHPQNATNEDPVYSVINDK